MGAVASSVRYLGIDGGGSKTTFLLVDDYYNEVCHLQSGPSNWISVGQEAAEAARAASLRGVAVDRGAGVAVIDDEPLGERFAAEEAPASLRFDGGGDLHGAAALPLRW